ncbi:MAG: hypothetical protein ACKO1L_09620 [Brachymonas sp.]
MNELSAQASQRSALKPDARGRLILQDPIAFDQAVQPSLRISAEMASPDVPVMDRESAREMWESLSMEPVQAQQLQAERKRLLARANQLASEAERNAAELRALKAQAAIERDNRWKHPLLYVGAAGIVGLGALWLLERRKRMQLQERELQAWTVQAPPDSLTDDSNSQPLERMPMAEDFYAQSVQEPVHRKRAFPKDEKPDAHFVDDLEDLPDLGQDFATDLTGLPDDAKSPARAPSASMPRTEAVGTPDRNTANARVLPQPKSQVDAQDTPLQSPAWATAPRASEISDDEELRLVSKSAREYQESLLDKSRRMLRSILQRRSQRDAAISSHAPTQVISTGMGFTGMSTLVHPEDAREAVQWLPSDEAREAFEQEQMARLLQAQLHDGRSADYNPDRANIELLSQTRLKPISQDQAVEHLLELRTAVSGLAVLGRPEGALVLLADHIDAHPDTCAWAYLEHMLLCERLDLRDEFESMRKRYRLQFNRMAPYWHEPNANVLGLDGYSRAASELCTAWAQGVEQAHALIAAWLIGPMLGRKLVQLPAYHDLFDLYELLEFTPENLAADAQVERARTAFDQKLHDAAQEGTERPQDDFVPTVSLLDLDYEFSTEVTLEEKAVQEAERSVTIVKLGNFSVDFNVAGAQLGGLFSVPAELEKK